MLKYRLLSLASAGLIAFVIVEIILAVFVKFPRYGAEKAVIGIRKSRSIQNIYKPFSSYWNTEGKWTVFKRNNVGLIGCDISIQENSNYIFVLGDSLIEAIQIHPTDIAISKFHKKVQKIDKKYQVVNVAGKGHDPYDLWFRCEYFKKTFKPDNVILVIASTYQTWMKRHSKPLKFDFPKEYGEKLKSAEITILNFFRNKSSFCNLSAAVIVKAIMHEINNPDVINPKDMDLSTPAEGSMQVPEELYLCISRFKEEYRDKFILLSVMDDKATNEELEKFCKDKSINFNYSLGILQPSNRIKGKGHLNEIGNRKLGDLLYETYTEFARKQ